MGRQLDDAFSGPGGGGGGPQGAPADVGRQLGGGFNAFPAVTQQQPPNLVRTFARPLSVKIYVRLCTLGFFSRILFWQAHEFSGFLS